MQWDDETDYEQQQQQQSQHGRSRSRSKNRSSTKCLCIGLVGLLALFGVICCVIVFIRQQELSARYEDIVEKMNDFETKQWKHDKEIETHERKHTMGYMKQQGNHIVLMPPPVLRKGHFDLKKRQIGEEATTAEQEIISVDLSTDPAGNIDTHPHASWSVSREINGDDGSVENIMTFGFEDEQLSTNSLGNLRKRNVESSDSSSSSDRPFSSDTSETGKDTTEDSDDDDDDGSSSSGNGGGNPANETCTGKGCLAEFDKKAITVRGKKKDRRVGIFNKNPSRTLDVNGDVIVREDFKACGPNIEFCGKVQINGTLCINETDITPLSECTAEETQQCIDTQKACRKSICQRINGTAVCLDTIDVEQDGELCDDFDPFTGPNDRCRNGWCFGIELGACCDPSQNICSFTSREGCFAETASYDNFFPRKLCSQIPCPAPLSVCSPTQCPQPKPCHKVVCINVNEEPMCLDGLLDDETPCNDPVGGTCVSGMCMGPPTPAPTPAPTPEPTPDFVSECTEEQLAECPQPKPCHKIVCTVINEQVMCLDGILPDPDQGTGTACETPFGNGVCLKGQCMPLSRPTDACPADPHCPLRTQTSTVASECEEQRAGQCKSHQCVVENSVCDSTVPCESDGEGCFCAACTCIVENPLVIDPNNPGDSTNKVLEECVQPDFIEPCSQDEIDDCPLPKPCHKVVCQRVNGEPMCLDGLLEDNTECDDENPATPDGTCNRGMCITEMLFDLCPENPLCPISSSSEIVDYCIADRQGTCAGTQCQIDDGLFCEPTKMCINDSENCNCKACTCTTTNTIAGISNVLECVGTTGIDQCNELQQENCPEPKPCHKIVCQLVNGEPMCLDGLLEDDTVCNDPEQGIDDGQCTSGMCMQVVTTPAPTPEPTSACPNLKCPFAVNDISSDCILDRLGTCQAGKCFINGGITPSCTANSQCEPLDEKEGEPCTCVDCICLNFNDEPEICQPV